MVVVASATALAFGRLPRRAAVDPATLPAVNVVEADGLRYEYDARTDRELLFVLSAAPDARVDVSKERPADVRRLREEMIRRLGIDGIETLRDAHAAEGEELRRLGYL